MLSTSALPGSADGLRWFSVYGLQDASDLSCFIAAQPYDFRFPPPEAIDPRVLSLDNPPVLGLDFGLELGPDTSLSYTSGYDIPFGDNFGWLQGSCFGQRTMPEMQKPGAVPVGGGGTSPVTQVAARSCSPTSETYTLSDGASFSSGFSSPSRVSSPTSSAGPSGSQHRQPVPGLSVGNIGPVRRGRGRPRKDAPPVYQPPPLCTYVDPLTGASCGKMLNRHHDLPRHMVKHRQEEAALVNAGRLARDQATLLPPGWEHDELKFACRFCSTTFSRADAVKRHERREHGRRGRKS